jgi:hypothetical protein
VAAVGIVETDGSHGRFRYSRPPTSQWWLRLTASTDSNADAPDQPDEAANRKPHGHSTNCGADSPREQAWGRAKQALGAASRVHPCGAGVGRR